MEDNLEKYLSPASAFSAELRSFVAQCVQRNPSLRPSARDLLSHPFLTQHAAANANAVPADLQALLNRSTLPPAPSAAAAEAATVMAPTLPAGSAAAAAAAQAAASASASASAPAAAAAVAVRQPIVWSSSIDRYPTAAAAAATTATTTSTAHAADDFEFVYEESTLDEHELQALSQQPKTVPAHSAPPLRIGAAAAAAAAASSSAAEATSAKASSASTSSPDSDKKKESEKEKQDKERQKHLRSTLDALIPYRLKQATSAGPLASDEIERLCAAFQTSVVQFKAVWEAALTAAAATQSAAAIASLRMT
jgi:hypothetical protein